MLVLWGKGYTRSHSEHGSKVFYHQWYCASGRVGRRQHKAFNTPKNRLRAVFLCEVAADILCTAREAIASIVMCVIVQVPNYTC